MMPVRWSSCIVDPIPADSTSALAWWSCNLLYRRAPSRRASMVARALHTQLAQFQQREGDLREELARGAEREGVAGPDGVASASNFFLVMMMDGSTL